MLAVTNVANHGGNKRKLPCVTVRRSFDEKAQGQESVITDDAKVDIWNSARINAEIYQLGVESLKVVLSDEAFKLLEAACTAVLVIRGSMSEHGKAVTKLRNFVIIEAENFGLTLSEGVFWPSTVDFGVFCSALARLKELTPPSKEKVLYIIAKGFQLFQEIFEDVLTDLESNSDSICKEGVMMNSLEFGKCHGSTEVFVNQFAYLARTKRKRNSFGCFAHPFWGGVMTPEAIQVYACIVQQRGYKLQEVGGLCLLNLHVQQQLAAERARMEADIHFNAYMQIFQKWAEEPSSPTDSDILEDELEAEKRKNEMATAYH